MRPADSQSLAVGFFDGVHMGHRAILSRATSALTFRDHPMALIDPARKPRLIMTLDDRLAAIRSCGIERVEVLDFTPALASMPPEEFAKRFILSKQFNKVVCGEDWRFGRSGAGDADFLRAMGIEVEEVAYAAYDGIRVSSSRIRRTLESGDIVSANAMLSRRFKIRGRVFSGKGLGGKLGFPTVNLMPEGLEIKLPRGVYEVCALGVKGLANYGVAPTMGENAWKQDVFEAHFLETPGCDISEIELVRFLRPELKFASLEELQLQIKNDFDKIKA